MRLREKKYSDYGITDDEKRRILDFCRNASVEERKIVKTALADINPYIQQYVYESLVNNLSYDDLCKKADIYMCAVDFYAYRRKGMAAVKQELIRRRLWKG